MGRIEATARQFVTPDEKRPVSGLVVTAAWYAALLATLIATERRGGGCGNCSVMSVRQWWYALILVPMPLHMGFAVLGAVRDRDPLVLVPCSFHVMLAALALISLSETGEFISHGSPYEMLSSLVGRAWWLTFCLSTLLMRPLLVVRLDPAWRVIVALPSVAAIAWQLNSLRETARLDVVYWSLWM